jgi:hypothetical protein
MGNVKKNENSKRSGWESEEMKKNRMKSTHSKEDGKYVEESFENTIQQKE